MTARYKSRMYDTEDQAREAYDLLEWAGVHARVVGPIRTEIIDRQGAVTGLLEEWEVNIVIPPQLPDTPAAAKSTAIRWRGDHHPDEHDVGRSTIWDELKESRD